MCCVEKCSQVLVLGNYKEENKIKLLSKLIDQQLRNISILPVTVRRHR